MILYSLEKTERTVGFPKGGGVAIYNIRDTLRVCLSPSLNNSTFEASVWCDIYINDSMISVGVCYRSTSNTNVNDDELICLMEKAASESSARNSQLLLMGDFNYPEISYNEHSVSAANDSSAKRFLTVHKICFSVSALTSLPDVEPASHQVSWTMCSRVMMIRT